jgi:anti-anti-sigma factor
VCRESDRAGELLLSVRGADGPAPVVGVRGEIDTDNAHHLRAAVDTLLVAGPVSSVAIDLGEVTFLDTMGISALVSCYRAVTRHGARFTVQDPSDTVYRQLYICGLLGMFGCPRRDDIG